LRGRRSVKGKSGPQTERQPEQERIAYLEQTIQTEDEVLAELMAEFSKNSFCQRMVRPFVGKLPEGWEACLMELSSLVGHS